MVKAAAELNALSELKLGKTTMNYIGKRKWTKEEAILQGRVHYHVLARYDEERVDVVQKWARQLIFALDAAGYIRHDIDDRSLGVARLYRYVVLGNNNKQAGLERFGPSYYHEFTNETYENYQGFSDEQIRRVIQFLDVKLPLEQARVIKLRFGLHDGRCRTASDVVKYLNFEMKEVRLAETRALNTLMSVPIRWELERLLGPTEFEKVIAENAIENLGLSKNETELRAFAALRSVGLHEKLYYQSPFELSGGQKRRVAIAGVLAMRPEILILDEPTAGLDPKGRDEILQLVAGLHEKENMTVILVSHSMEDIANYVERILVMDGGKIVMDGAPRQIFSRRKELEEMGLGVPQVTEILFELKARGMAVDTSAITLEDAKNEILRVLGK